MAEALLNHRGHGLYHAFSAGSQPTGTVNPLAIQLLKHYQLPIEGLHSKSWDEFTLNNTPKIDFVITVCDKAAQESCPRWSGQPLTAHWGVPDPAAISGSKFQKIQAFQKAFKVLGHRIECFLQLPIEALDHLKLKKELDSIGKLNI